MSNLKSFLHKKLVKLFNSLAGPEEPGKHFSLPILLLSPREKSLEEDEEQGEAEDEVGEVEHGGGEGVDGVPVHVEGEQPGVLQIFENIVNNS